MITFQSDIEKQDWQHAFKIFTERNIAATTVEKLSELADRYIEILRERAKPVELVVSYKVLLHSCGPDKISCIKLIRKITGSGLQDAKNMSEADYAIVRKDLTIDSAESIVARFHAIGAVASYVRVYA